MLSSQRGAPTDNSSRNGLIVVLVQSRQLQMLARPQHQPVKTFETGDYDLFPEAETQSGRYSPADRPPGYGRKSPMVEQKIRFDDGAAYEQTMGIWSRFAGEIFLDWLAPLPDLRWIDVGCGNGAFTQLLVERCAPAEVQGIDPSEGQLAFARARSTSRVAEFRQGDAMALPFPAGRFDAAVMALAIIFVLAIADNKS